MSIRLAVVGSRDFIRLDRVDEYILDLYANGGIDCIVSGGARGVDRAAESLGLSLHVPVVSFRPTKVNDRWVILRVTTGEAISLLPGSYPSFGAAAFTRNGFIVEFADAVVAFWDGHSRGTHDSIERARECGNLRDIVRG